MAKIPDGAFQDWHDTETINATEYKREREMLRVAANDNDTRLSSLEESAAGILLGTVQAQKITNDSGGVKLSTTSTNDDILAMILKEGKGFHTFYAVGGSKNLPSTNLSIRGIAHLSDDVRGWVYATDYQNNIFTNYVDNSVWTGWKQLARKEEVPTNTDWTVLTLGPGLTKYAAGTELRWKRVGDIVHITGLFTGDLDWDEVITTLPSNARPTYTHHFLAPTSVYTRSEGRNARYEIGTDGKLKFITTNDGIIGTSDWYAVNTSFAI
jgi:hypothetical protein